MLPYSCLPQTFEKCFTVWKNILSVEYITDQISCHLSSTQYRPDAELSTFTHTISNACEPLEIPFYRWGNRPRDLTWLSPLTREGHSIQCRCDKVLIPSLLIRLPLCSSVCVHAKSPQLCPTLRNPLDCSWPGSFVHGIFQARILEWVSMPSSRALPNSGIKPASLKSPALAVRFFTTSANWGALCSSGYLEYYYLFRVFYVLSFLDGQANYLLPQNT